MTLGLPASRLFEGLSHPWRAPVGAVFSAHHPFRFVVGENVCGARIEFERPAEANGDVAEVR